MFEELKKINTRPALFEFYTARELWTNTHTAQRMLEYHLNDAIDASSRNSKFIDSSVAWMTEYFSINETTAIADFGCGPGLYASRLAKNGATVTGIDFSANSINYATKKAAEQKLHINYEVADYLEYMTMDRFDLIIMIMCDYCALSPVQRKHLLRKFRTLLKPNGAILLDVYSLNMFNSRVESATYEFNQLNGFWSPDDYYCFVNTFKYEKEKVILDKYTIFEKSGKREVYNWMQCYSKESLQKEFEDNGLTVETIVSDVAGEKYDPKSDCIAIIGR